MEFKKDVLSIIDNSFLNDKNQNKPNNSFLEEAIMDKIKNKLFKEMNETKPKMFNQFLKYCLF